MRLSILIILLLLPIFVFAQDAKYDVGKLQKSNEEIILAFKTKNRKIVTVNADKDHRYIVFRYGDKDSVKFQYPAALNEKSWEQFTYCSQVQRNNKPDASEKYKLSFFHNGIRYTVSQYLHIPTEDEELELQITGIVDGCLLSAKPKTRMGSLAALRDSQLPRDIIGEE